MNQHILTITTDFGDQLATAQLKAVIASLHFSGQVIENHDVTAYSIVEGAFAIDLVAKYTPNGTVHVGVIDPGVGSTRMGIIIKTKHSFLVGPNNGLFSEVTKREGIEKVWKIDEAFFGKVATTFHGRDVFCKVGVLLAQGKQPEGIGAKEIDASLLEHLTIKKGQILHIDRYGNLKVFWPHLSHKGNLVLTSNGKHHTLPVVKTFTDVPLHAPLAYKGSSDTLEIALHQGSAQEYFQTKVGEVLQLQTI